VAQLGIPESSWEVQDAIAVLDRLKRCWEVRRLIKIFADQGDLDALELHIHKVNDHMTASSPG
jgi:hypothetical protein